MERILTFDERFDLWLKTPMDKFDRLGLFWSAVCVNEEAGHAFLTRQGVPRTITLTDEGDEDV